MKLNIKKLGSAFIRIMKFIAILAVFVLDVKVKAEIVISKVEDDVDFEISGKVKQAKGIKKISARDVGIETSTKGKVKFDLGEHHIVLMSRTHCEITGDNQAVIYRGTSFFRSSLKKSQTLTIKTPHGVVFTKGAEFFLMVNEVRTRVGVIEGKVSFSDRISEKENILEAGFSMEIGGLRSNGSRRVGSLEPINFEVAKIILEQAQFKTGEKLSAQVEELEGKWKYAISVVSLKYQNQINTEIQELTNIEKKYLAKKSAEKAERDAIRRHLRAKIMGLDPEDFESRSPASNQ